MCEAYQKKVPMKAMAENRVANRGGEWLACIGQIAKNEIGMDHSVETMLPLTPDGKFGCPALCTEIPEQAGDQCRDASSRKTQDLFKKWLHHVRARKSLGFSSMDDQLGKECNAAKNAHR